MRELTTISPDKEISITENNKETRIASLNIHRGHTLYEIDLAELTITPAVYESTNVHIGGDLESNTIVHKLMVKKGCLYISALNIKNCRKKFFQKYGQKNS